VFASFQDRVQNHRSFLCHRLEATEALFGDWTAHPSYKTSKRAGRQGAQDADKAEFQPGLTILAIRQRDRHEF